MKPASAGEMVKAMRKNGKPLPANSLSGLYRLRTTGLLWWTKVTYAGWIVKKQ